MQSNVSLKSLNTFAVDAVARNYIEINSITELQALHPFTDTNLLILGGGSNILFVADVFDGLVLHINLKGLSIVEKQSDHVIVKAMAGEDWNGFVSWCLQQSFGGLENLSLIPGRVGAAPVQNIGAYGVELKDVVHEVEAFNRDSGEVRIFNREECQFAYRGSLFKSAQKNQWIILSVCFRLTRENHQLHLDYGAIRQTLEDDGIFEPTIQDVGQAVVQIRQQRLPDPATTANAGSFFKNPVVSQKCYRELLDQHSQMPGYELQDGTIKLAAGWLIEQCGWKGKKLGNCSVHSQHALVLVNNGEASGEDIVALAEAICADVKKRFSLQLQPEVNFI